MAASFASFPEGQPQSDRLLVPALPPADLSLPLKPGLGAIPKFVRPAKAAERTHHSPAGRPLPLRSGLRYDQLLAYIAARPSLSILEIGVAKAANLLRMMAYADSLYGKPRYTGIDLFGSLTEEAFRESYNSDAKRPLSVAETMDCLRGLLGAEICGRVELCEGYSDAVLPKLLAGGRTFDLIFIDGGHSLEAVQADWRFSQQMLALGGTIVFDDYPNWGVLPVVEAIDRKAWHVRVLPHVDTFKNHRTDENPAETRSHQLVEAKRK